MSNIKLLDKEAVDAESLMNRPGYWQALVGITGFIIGLAAYIVVEKTSNIIDVDRGFDITLTWMPLSMIFLVVSFGFSVVAVIKVKRFMKIIPIFIILASIVLFLLAWLAYSFSKPAY